MKVFISWSGDQSKRIAEQFRKWLPSVIQAVKPYFSPDDIAKGARWNSEISKELEASNFGIICLTRDNLSAPWLMFEAGALAKNLERGKVCPIVLGLAPTDVTDPLAQFQCARFEKSEIKKIVKAINTDLGEKGLTQDVLDSVFEMWWPQLDTNVNAILDEQEADATEDLRTEKDLLEEILLLQRRTVRSSRSSRIHPAAIRDLVRGFSRIVDEIEDLGLLPVLSGELGEFQMPLEHVFRKSDADDEEVEALFQGAIKKVTEATDGIDDSSSGS